MPGDWCGMPRVIAIALSGGRDSAALLHAAQAVAAQQPASLRVIGLHVHHGLQAGADDWERFCRAQCGQLGAGFESLRAHVAPKAGEGLEAAARRARYAALANLCRNVGAGLLLFAHHLDDQVETVLLRLFRGSGVHGLSGMPAMRELDMSAADDDGMGEAIADGRAEGRDRSHDDLRSRRAVILLRPWLDVPRDEIDAYCEANGLSWIDDPSNIDPRYARNALRAQMPALLAAFPGLRGNVTQAAAHFAEAASMIDRQAAEALAGLLRPGRDATTLAELDLTGLRRLPAALGDAVLRLWLRNLGTRAPSTARLAAMRDQLIAHEGGEPAIAHDGVVLLRFRTSLLACVGGPAAPARPLQLPPWQGEAAMPVPAWQGTLTFERDDAAGIPEAVLTQSLRLAPRSGGERIVLRPGGPARALKQACQEAGIPAWRRQRLPLLWAGKQLLFVAGLGMHCRWPVDIASAAGSRWRVGWVEWAQSARNDSRDDNGHAKTTGDAPGGTEVPPTEPV